jgi:hemerythrin superfamily protein
MVTKQIIQEKLDNLTEEQLNQVYEIIEQLSSSEQPVKKPSLMSQLQKISIDNLDDLFAWDQAIDQINNSQQNQEKIKQLFESWAKLDDENEQKEILKIIESLEGVSI